MPRLQRGDSLLGGPCGLRRIHLIGPTGPRAHPDTNTGVEDVGLVHGHPTPEVRWQESGQGALSFREVTRASSGLGGQGRLYLVVPTPPSRELVMGPANVTYSEDGGRGRLSSGHKPGPQVQTGAQWIH